MSKYQISLLAPVLLSEHRIKASPVKCFISYYCQLIAFCSFFKKIISVIEPPLFRSEHGVWSQEEAEKEDKRRQRVAQAIQETKEEDKG